MEKSPTLYLGSDVFYLNLVRDQTFSVEGGQFVESTKQPSDEFLVPFFKKLQKEH